MKCPVNAFASPSLLPSTSFRYPSTQTRSCSWVPARAAIPHSSAHSHTVVTGQSSLYDPAGPTFAISCCVHLPSSKASPRKASKECSHQWGAAAACSAQPSDPTFTKPLREHPKKLPKDLLLPAWKGSPFWQ